MTTELSDREENLHLAVCQAVGVLNTVGDPHAANRILKAALEAWAMTYEVEYFSPNTALALSHQCDCSIFKTGICNCTPTKIQITRPRAGL